MAISFAQTPANASTTSDDGIAISTTNPVAVGNRVLLLVAAYDDGDFNDPWSPSSAISKSGGTATVGTFAVEANTCTREIYGGNPGSHGTVLYSVEVTGAGTLELTFDPGTSGTDYVAVICEVTDVNFDAGAEDFSDLEGGSTSPYDSEDMTSAGAAMFIGVWLGEAGDSGTITPATGFTEIYEVESSVPCSFIYKVVSSGTTDAVEWSAVASSSWDVSAAVFTEEVAYTIQQEGFRFYDDDADEGSNTPLANQDIDITIAPETPFLLRVLGNATGDRPTEQATLQYRKVGDAASEWETIA
jgi:hypothetical protein